MALQKRKRRKVKEKEILLRGIKYTERGEQNKVNHWKVLFCSKVQTRLKKKLHYIVMQSYQTLLLNQNREAAKNKIKTRIFQSQKSSYWKDLK